MTWHTPLGLPVVQPYRRKDKQHVRTLLQVRWGGFVQGRRWWGGLTRPPGFFSVLRFRSNRLHFLAMHPTCYTLVPHPMQRLVLVEDNDDLPIMHPI